MGEPSTSTTEPNNVQNETQPPQQPSTLPPPIEPNKTSLVKYKNRGAATISTKNLILHQSDIPAVDEFNMKECDECHFEFLRSYLYKNFSLPVCDNCRDPKGIHEMITRTDAKTKYLLKDCDFDLRKPPLRFILKKNPHANRGDMKLYLKLQVEERAILVHGSEDNLEEELEKREERRTIKKQKVYDKQMKSLARSVRSNLVQKRAAQVHSHEYGDPVCIDEDNDMFRKECKTCGHRIEYEEM